MSRQFGKNRKPSTVVRDNHVHQIYKEVMYELGEYAHYLPRYIIYGKIGRLTGLCAKTIATILNHTVSED